METKSYTHSRVVSDYECENRTLESNEICQIEAEEHDEELFEEVISLFGDGWTLEYDNNQSGTTCYAQFLIADDAWADIGISFYEDGSVYNDARTFYYNASSLEDFKENLTVLYEENVVKIMKLLAERVKNQKYDAVDVSYELNEIFDFDLDSEYSEDRRIIKAILRNLDEDIIEDIDKYLDKNSVYMKSLN
jgi:hypothetical protein